MNGGFHPSCYKQQTQIEQNVEGKMRVAVSKIKPGFFLLNNAILNLTYFVHVQ